MTSAPISDSSSAICGTVNCPHGTNTPSAPGDPKKGPFHMTINRIERYILDLIDLTTHAVQGPEFSRDQEEGP
jgi:hypothetical protein